MSMPSFWIQVDDLAARVGTARAPILYDVCCAEAFACGDRVIAGAKWRDLSTLDGWAGEIPADAEVVVNCLHGHQMSQSAVARLRHKGINARVVEGGIAAYIDADGVTVAKSDALPEFYAGPTRWVTREQPQVDRIACLWFIKRFADPTAEILFVQAEWVEQVAVEFDAVPFDIQGTDFSHDGDKCSFDAFLDRFGVEDKALHHVARIVRGADTGQLDLEPQAAGLLALSLGLSAANDDDRATLVQGMVIYDALYSWCRNATAETHNWPAQAASQ